MIRARTLLRQRWLLLRSIPFDPTPSRSTLISALHTPYRTSSSLADRLTDIPSVERLALPSARASSSESLSSTAPTADEDAGDDDRPLHPDPALRFLPDIRLLETDINVLQSEWEQCIVEQRMEGLWKCIQIWQQCHRDIMVPFHLCLQAMDAIRENVQQPDRVASRLAELTEMAMATIQKQSTTVKVSDMYQKLVRVLSVAKQFPLVEQVVRRMKDQGFDVDTTTSAQIIQQLVAEGRFKRALLYYKSLDLKSGKDEDAQALDTATVLGGFIKGCALTGDIKRMLMFRDAKLKTGYAPNSDEICVMLTALFRAENVKMIEEWEVQFKDGVLETTPEICQRFILEYGKQGDHDGVKRWYDKGNAVAPNDRYIQSEMICALSRLNLTEEAGALYREMRHRSVKPSFGACNAMMHMFVKQGDLSTAQSIFNELPRLGYRPDRYSFSIMMNGYVKQKDVRSAQILFELMKKHDVAPSHVSYTTLMEGFAKSRQMERLMNSYDEMKQQGIPIDAVTGSVMLFGSAWSGDFEKTMDIFRELKWDMSSGLQGDPSDALEDDDDVDERLSQGDAVSLLHGVKARPAKLKLNSYIYNAMIYANGRHGDMITAQRLFAEMQGTDVPVNVHTFNALLAGCIFSKTVGLSKSIVQTMRESNILPSVGTYALLMEISSMENRCDNALKLFRILVRDENVDMIPSFVVATLLRALDQHDHVNTLKETFELLRDPKMRTKVELDGTAWKAYILSMLKHGEVGLARQGLMDMLNDVKTVPQTVVVHVLDAFNEAGHPSIAKEVMAYIEERRPLSVTRALRA